MRYIPIDKLREGMVLACPVYGGKFEVLLGEGLTLTGFHIQRLSSAGFAGMYIMDDLSDGIEVADIVPAAVRLNTVKAAKELWQQAERARNIRQIIKTPRARQEKLIMPVIDAVIANHSRLVEVIDLKPEEDYLYYHAARVVVLSIAIGVEAGLTGFELFELGMAALLHDVGNIFIPTVLLEKPGKLTPDEYEVVRSHTQKGFEYLHDTFDVSIEGCLGALQHHENYDGSGYPNGLEGDKISIYGRIISITDVYDALTSRRPFRKMLYPPEAMEYMNSRAGVMFDPGLLEAFQRIVPLYPTGVCVELDSGVRGIVEKNFPGDPARPRIRLLNSRAELPLFVDLHEDGDFINNQVTGIIEL